MRGPTWGRHSCLPSWGRHSCLPSNDGRQECLPHEFGPLELNGDRLGTPLLLEQNGQVALGFGMVGGQFHVVPHDVNETFGMPGGPGMRGGQSIKGIELDPLFGADDSNKPLISKLLAVPKLRARYLGYVRDIAEKWLGDKQ